MIIEGEPDMGEPEVERGNPLRLQYSLSL